MSWLRGIGAFIVRDALEDLSYRTAFLMNTVGILLFLAVWYFVPKFLLAQGAEVEGLPPFSWFLGGIALWQFLNVALSGFARRIRKEQLSGTLEAMMATPARTSLVLFGSTAWDFLFSALSLALYVLFGVWIFGAQIAVASIPAAIVVLVLTSLCFSGIGILAASAILYFKRGDPITFLVSGVMQLFGGVYFPASALGPRLQAVAEWIPLTHATRAFRATLLGGASLGSQVGDLAALAGFSLLVIPLGLAMARVAIGRARRDGTLAHY